LPVPVVCRLMSPCDGCAAPYGFRNQLILTEDTARFRVIHSAISVIITVAAAAASRIL